MPAETINLIVTQDFNITTTMAFVNPFRVANYINGAPLYLWEFLSEHGGHLRSRNGAILETTAMQAVNAPTDYTIEEKRAQWPCGKQVASGPMARGDQFGPRWRRNH